MSDTIMVDNAESIDCDDVYLEAVFKREASQPTGLSLPYIPVAIPHAEAEHCTRPAIAVGILERPVDFGEMGGDQGTTLPVQIVFLLALNNPEQQVQWLQRLVELFQRPAAEFAGIAGRKSGSRFPSGAASSKTGRRLIASRR